MATAIEEAVTTHDTLIVESGTGTGKTFGYLVPAIANRKKVIVSTFTNHLQSQLFEKDIPKVCKLLNMHPDVQMLLGRRHYLCQFRFENWARNPTLGFSQSSNRASRIVQQRLDGSQTGELDELLSGLSHQRALKSQLKSTTENCLRSQCSWWNDCWVYKARKRAREADILVVNHNLLCLNMMMQNESENGFLPTPDVIVVDEAQHLPSIAAETLGISVSSGRFKALCDDFEEMAGAFQLNPVVYAGVISDINRLSSDLHTGFNESDSTGTLEDLKLKHQFMANLNGLVDNVRHLSELLSNISNDVPQVEPCMVAANKIVQDTDLLLNSSPGDCADWYKVVKSDFQMNRVPLFLSSGFISDSEENRTSWIFTSATLAVGSDFSHFSNRLGLETVRTRQWDSPFPYRENSLLYLPPNMPEPNHAQFNTKVTELAISILSLSKGRAFILFTSYKALHEVHDLLKDEIDYEILVQDDSSSRYQLLEQFREAGDAVLLGTSSFWEGVDVKGEALSCVIIDKLPFAYHGDPVMRARINYMQSMDQNPFMEWQVPEAALTLKQGAGRLIRDVDDRGVLVLCDPRVRTKQYGSKFLESLPPMPQTDDVRKVKEFFRS